MTLWEFGKQIFRDLETIKFYIHTWSNLPDLPKNLVFFFFFCFVLFFFQLELAAQPYRPSTDSQFKKQFVDFQIDLYIHNSHRMMCPSAKSHLLAGLSLAEQFFRFSYSRIWERE